MSSFVGLEIARKGLTAQLKSIEVAGQNIAHANSPGYSRQVVQHSMSLIAQSGVGRGGVGLMGGVEIAGVHRQYDMFLSARVRQLISGREEVEVRQDVLARLEELINEPGEATIGTALDDLWTAWGQLATNPENEAARNTVLYRANTVALSFREAADDMLGLQVEQAQKARDAVDEINALVESLTRVNENILAVARTVGSSPPNALLDTRDGLLEQLAELVDIQVHERSLGDIQILVGGRTLVDAGRTMPITLTKEGSNLGLSVAHGGEIAAVGGHLAGIMTAHNEDLPKYMGMLDDLARSLMAEVNAMHRQGHTPAGAAGTDFFQGSGAGDIHVVLDAKQVAVSAGNAGKDGLIAQALADLRHVAHLQEQSVGQQYSSLLGELGAETASLQIHHANMVTLAQFAHVRKESVSGVSLDEELVDVLRFQQSYAAAARFLTAIDEALEILVSRTGHVGR